MAMVKKDFHKEESDRSKVTYSASEEENSSSDDSSEVKESGSSLEQQIGGDEVNGTEYDDTFKTDEGDEQSDSGHLRHSKRKPSKSRIKRILNKQMPVQNSQDTHIALPSIDSLMTMRAPSTIRSQASMVPGPAPAYLQMTGNHQRTPGAYKCDTCGKVFRVPSRYESHMQSHSKGKPFCCDVCGKMFASKERLAIHTPVHGRNRKDAYECPTCQHKCANWRAYLYHVSRHTANGGKKHECRYCGRHFFAAQRLRNHVRSHLVGKNFCCLKCGKLFESQKRLDTHSLIHTAGRQDSFSCVDCGKVYDDWRAFKQHMKTHGSDGVIYTCEICFSQFITQYEKEKHMKVHASDQRYPCSQCKKCFRIQSQLAVHMRNKHQGNGSYDCMICGRECARASGLKQHMKMHAGEESFFCHMCGQTFQKGIDLTEHASAHAGDRQFSCDQCGKCFAKKIHYHRHLMVHAAGQQFSCAVCGKQFDHSLQLTSHMAIHSLDSQHRYACLACSCTFTSQLELEAHAHSHGKSAPYVCGLCGKLFAEQRYFRQHMKRHAARAQKQKLHARGALGPSGTTVKTKDAATLASSSQGSIDQTCHMCGEEFASHQDFMAHIEEHKRSGLLVYLNMMGKKGNKAHGTQQIKQKLQNTGNGSERESETASESDSSDRGTPKRSRSVYKSTIHFGMQSPMVDTSVPADSKSSTCAITQTSEQAMEFQRPLSATETSNSATSITSINNNVASSGVAPVMTPDLTPHNRNGDGSANRFYSSPVFPGQSGNYVTPYHAAAQRFQHSSQEHFVNGSTEPGMDITGQFASSAKRLPDFADFRHHLDLPNTGGFPDYSGSVSAACQYSSGNQLPAMTGTYCQSELPSGYYPSNGDPMSGNSEASASVPLYPSMSVFPTMPSQSQGTNGHHSDQRGNMQQEHFAAMLQFQTLGLRPHVRIMRGL